MYSKEVAQWSYVNGQRALVEKCTRRGGARIKSSWRTLCRKRKLFDIYLYIHSRRFFEFHNVILFYCLSLRRELTWTPKSVSCLVMWKCTYMVAPISKVGQIFIVVDITFLNLFSKLFFSFSSSFGRGQLLSVCIEWVSHCLVWRCI